MKKNMMKKIDAKLRNIRAGNYTRADFMIADAKDADMGGGIGMAGPRRRPDGTFDGMRTRREYLDAIRAVVEQGVVDITLVSASNLEVLTEEGVFATSGVQPAIRVNETTDVWGCLRHGSYTTRMSVPHRSAVLSRAMYGTSVPNPDGAVVGTDLGLYSMRFNNDLDADLRTLEAFKEFRAEAGRIGFRYFLEVFNPNAPIDLDPTMIAPFVNDHIVRSLAGVVKADRPQFLKIPYNGPAALEELAAFDPTVGSVFSAEVPARRATRSSSSTRPSATVVASRSSAARLISPSRRWPSSLSYAKSPTERSNRLKLSAPITARCNPKASGRHDRSKKICTSLNRP